METTETTPIMLQPIKTDFSNEDNDPEMELMLRNTAEKSPKEALQNITRANRLGIHPDSYNDIKNTMNPEAAIQERVPASVEPAVKEYAANSSEHAAVVAPEVGILDSVARQAKYIWYNLTEKQNIQNEIMAYNRKDRLSDNGLDATDQEYLNGLYDQQQEEENSFGISETGKIIGKIAGVGNDMYQIASKNKTIIASSAALFGGAASVNPLAPVTAPVGALLGASAAMTGLMFSKGYEDTTESTYGDLRRMKDDNGQPLNLPRETMNNLSMGLGITSGILQTVVGKTLMGGIEKVAAKKVTEYVVKNTAMKTALELLGNVAKTSAVGGTEQVAVHLNSLVVENYAKGDQSEAGLLNAIHATIKTAKNLGDPEILKSLGISFAVGGGAAGAMSAASTIPFAKKMKAGYDQNNINILELEKQNIQIQQFKDATASINHQADFMTMAHALEQSNIKQMSPEQAKILTEGMFKQAGYKDKIFFTPDDLLEIGKKNPELADKMKTLDVTEAAKNNTGAAIGIVPHEFLALVGEAPTISEYARRNPEAPNPFESKNFLASLNDAQKARDDLFASLGPEDKLTSEQIVTLNKLDKNIEDVSNVTGANYLDQPTFTYSIENGLSESVVKKYNDAQMSARKNVLDQVNKEFEISDQNNQDMIGKVHAELVKNEEIQKLKQESEVVEKFKANKKNPSDALEKKGFSPLAIDPKFLPENLREAYLADPKLNSRKVFAEGGMSPDESAAIAGIKDGETLLKILANAPTKEEMLANIKKRSIEEMKQFKDHQDEFYNKEQRRTKEINKAFDDKSDIQKREIDFMRTNKWTETKQGVKIIALPSPKIEEINLTARTVVNTTKVSELNPRQFLAAEKNFQKKSVNHILKNEIESACIAKENAILNNELTRESLLAKRKVDNAKLFIKRVTSKSGLETFKNAKMLPRVNEILDLIDMASNKDPKTLEKYHEYLVSQNEKGNNIIVPESLADVRQKGSDLTVQQYLRVTEELQSLNTQAKLKNKLLKNIAGREETKELQTIESVVTNLVEDLKTHPSFKEVKNKSIKELSQEEIKNQNSKTTRQLLGEKYAKAGAAVSNLKNIATELDQEKLGGKHYENIPQKMVDGETYKRFKLLNITDHIKKIADDHGLQKFEKAFNEEIYIPEFNGYTTLGNGKMVKSDLWRLWMTQGDPQAKERYVNFIHSKTSEPLTPEIIKRVLERELTHEDCKTAQNFTNIFKSFEEETKALHERTTGVTPTMVKGVPIEHNGVMYDGGYVPLDYLNTSPAEKAARFLDVYADKKIALFGEKGDEGKMYASLRAAEQTDQGRLIDRTGSTRPLDTNFGNLFEAYEEIVHDLAYRERGTDVLNLLKNELYSKAIIETVGEAKYKTMVNGVIETVGKPEDISPFSGITKDIMKTLDFFQSNFAVKTLGFNPTSVLKQPLSLGSAALRMGPNGPTYLAKSAGHILMNAHKYNTEIFEKAAEINPNLRLDKDFIDDTMSKTLRSNVIPGRKRNGKIMTALEQGHEYIVSSSMLGLKHADIHVKVVATLAAHSQFLNGDVENFPMSRLNKMSDTEKFTKAANYAKQVSDLALTTTADIDKNAIQKMTGMRMFTMFYNDLRSEFNTLTSQKRKIINSAKQSQGEFQQGNVSKGIGYAVKGGIQLGSLMGVVGVMQVYQDTLMGEKTPISSLSKVNDWDSFRNYMGDTAKYVASAPITNALGSLPVVNTIAYAASNKYQGQMNIRTPITQGLTEFTSGVVGLSHLLSMSKKEKENAAGMVFGLPVNGPKKIIKMIEESSMLGDAGRFVGNQLSLLNENINDFVKSNPEQTDMINELREVQKNIIPPETQTAESLVPDNALEVLKTHKWNDQDPKTGAAGVYQFTEQRWNQISEQNPDLGLTENGRVSKDPSEQEKARKWEIEQHAKGLAAYQIPITNENLFGTHRFGLDDFTAVMLSKDNEQLSTIVGNKELFKGFKTVKDIKRYIKTIDKNKA